MDINIKFYWFSFIPILSEIMRVPKFTDIFIAPYPGYRAFTFFFFFLVRQVSYPLLIGQVHVYLFVHKKDDKIPPGLGASKCRINIFTLAVSFFNETKHRAFLKNLEHFMLFNAVFLFKFFNNLIVPDKTCDFQSCVLFFKPKISLNKTPIKEVILYSHGAFSTSHRACAIKSLLLSGIIFGASGRTLHFCMAKRQSLAFFLRWESGPDQVETGFSG